MFDLPNLLFLIFSHYVLIDKRKPTRGGLFGVCYVKKLLGLSFLFQVVALISYIFLLDVLTYVSVFSLWLGAILLGISAGELIQKNKKKNIC